MKILVILLLALSLSATTLKEVWDSSTSNGEFEKYLVLNAGETYTGGLVLSSEFDTDKPTKIVGKGAILDLENEKILIDRVDGAGFAIEDCVITNGGIEFKSFYGDIYPKGDIKYITFYEPLEYGIRMNSSGEDISVTKSIFHSAVWNGGTGFSPDGINVAIESSDLYGTPDIIDNWSYHIGEPMGDYSVHFSRV